MESFLVVTTKKGDISLLTTAQRRAIAGPDSTDTDADLLARDLAVGAGIMAECRIAVGQGNDPTLFQETLIETFYSVDVDKLMLARRHNIAITSITVDGTALATDGTAFFVNPESGLVTYLSNDCPRRWCARKIVVVYQAGFEVTPPDLLQAALDYFRAVTLEGARDPSVKAESVEIPGVQTRRTEVWAGALPGSAGASGIPDSVASQLGRFRNPGSV